MTRDNLPDGLRCVLVYVIESDLTSAPSAALDISLIRIANIAMQRKLNRNVEDALLFIAVGQVSSEIVEKTIAGYGFPNATVAYIEIDDDERRKSEAGLISSLIESEITKWLNREHSGAIGCFPNEYGAIDFWWSGIENDGRALEYPFEPVDFAAVLPDTHRSKSATWLTILAHVINLEATQDEVPDRLGLDIAAAWAATLCEWLHGFEAASENSYNDFGYETDSILAPSQFYLGFELARLTGYKLPVCCDDTDLDISEMQEVALKAITRNRRYEMRAALSDFFGGDGVLLWVLHAAIWPDIENPIATSLDLLLGSLDFDHLARIDVPWQFVTHGWHDSADN